MRIYKYDVTIAEKFTIPMPEGAAILSITMQAAKPKIWAMVDPAQQQRDRDFALVYTGQEAPELSSKSYIGTFQLHKSETGEIEVFHLFDLGYRI